MTKKIRSKKKHKESGERERERSRDGWRKKALVVILILNH
jgi:hypothetical protein